MAEGSDRDIPDWRKAVRSIVNAAGRERGVFVEVVVTVGVAVVFVCLAAWSLVGLVSAADGEKPLAKPSARSESDEPLPIREVELVRYDGLIELPVDEGGEQIVRIAEVELRGLTRFAPDETFSLDALLRRRRAALTEAVDVVLRTASPDELGDPENTALHPRLLERVNESLGADLIERLVFAHFRVFETPGVSR